MVDPLPDVVQRRAVSFAALSLLGFAVGFPLARVL